MRERVRECESGQNLSPHLLLSRNFTFLKIYSILILFVPSIHLCPLLPELAHAYAVISICLRFTYPLGHTCLFLKRTFNSASEFLHRSILLLLNVSGIFFSFCLGDRHAYPYPTRWGGGCASVQVNCLSERLEVKRDKLSKTIRRLTNATQRDECMDNKSFEGSANLELANIFFREMNN